MFHVHVVDSRVSSTVTSEHSTFINHKHCSHSNTGKTGPATSQTLAGENVGECFTFSFDFKYILSFKIEIDNSLIFSQLQKQLSVLPENNQGNEDPGVNSEDDDYDAEV